MQLSLSSTNLALKTKKVLELILISSFFLLFFISCKSSKFGINKAEAKYMEGQYRDVQIFHDKTAIKNSKNDGVYYVKITNESTCYYDTSTIKAMAQTVASKVVKFMNYREHYKYIDVEFSILANDLMQKELEIKPSCYYVVRMPLENLSEATVGYSVNSYVRGRRY